MLYILCIMSKRNPQLPARLNQNSEPTLTSLHLKIIVDAKSLIAENIDTNARGLQIMNKQKKACRYEMKNADFLHSQQELSCFPRKWLRQTGLF